MGIEFLCIWIEKGKEEFLRLCLRRWMANDDESKGWNFDCDGLFIGVWFIDFLIFYYNRKIASVTYEDLKVWIRCILLKVMDKACIIVVKYETF